jgi:hypothetical protein
MCAWHGVTPLLAKQLVGHPLVPDSVVDLLRKFGHTNAVKNLYLSAELMKLIAELNAGEVPCIPYKGTVLSEYLYGSTALRCVSDIDLIIRPEDVKKAIACLEEQGFSDGFALSISQRASALRYSCEYSLIRNGVSIDLHWRLVQHSCWPSLDMDRIWQSLTSFPFCGTEVQIFSPECLIATLCVHAAQHEWMQLKMFSDIAEILWQHPGLNWQVIEEWTADSHSRRSMLVTLSLTHSYLGAPLPPRIRDAIGRDHQVGLIADRVFSEMWPSQRNPTPAHTDVRWLLLRTKGERWADRWRYVSRMIFSPTMADFWNMELPSSLSRLHVVIRPLRIICSRLRGMRPGPQSKPDSAED